MPSADVQVQREQPEGGGNACACRYIQRCVRRFLRALYVRRRREAAQKILGFLQMCAKASRITEAFKRLMRALECIKVRAVALRKRT
jgi:hypothetical protein